MYIHTQYVIAKEREKKMADSSVCVQLMKMPAGTLAGLLEKSEKKKKYLD